MGLNLDRDIWFPSTCFQRSLGTIAKAKRVHALSNALCRQPAALLRQTECIWGNLMYNEIDLLTFNNILITETVGAVDSE